MLIDTVSTSGLKRVVVTILDDKKRQTPSCKLSLSRAFTVARWSYLALHFTCRIVVRIGYTWLQQHWNYHRCITLEKPVPFL